MAATHRERTLSAFVELVRNLETPQSLRNGKVEVYTHSGTDSIPASGAIEARFEGE